MNNKDDERLRKTTISFLKEFADKGYENAVECIDWLEKQAISSKKDVDDAYLKGVTDTKNEIEKQYEANYQIRKDIATFLFNYKGDIKDRSKWMNYLGIKVSFVEKQSEKPQGKSALEAINEEKVDNQNCVKSTDKVEPKFKVGDKIQHKNGYSLDVSILKINADCYTVKDFMGDQITIDFTHQDNYELVLDKFDLNTLKPFESSVLVRNSKDQYWIPAFWGYRAKDGYVTTFGHCNYCIPYEGNEHLLGTSDDCSDYMKQVVEGVVKRLSNNIEYDEVCNRLIFDL